MYREVGEGGNLSDRGGEGGEGGVGVFFKEPNCETGCLPHRRERPHKKSRKSSSKVTSANFAQIRSDMVFKFNLL